MGDLGAAGTMERWVCPNDRQLALRAKLGTGWSIHTNKPSAARRGESLTLEEQEQIMKVVQRAETLETMEMERVGKLVERLDNMKKHAMGNGSTQCVLCGEEFGLLASSATLCYDCRKAVCSKCSVDTKGIQPQSVWLCKICSEHRELWKKSGAWFFRSLPRYTVPTRKADTPDVKNQSKRSSHERSVASSVNQVTSQSKTYSSSWSKSASKSDRHAPSPATAANDDHEMSSSDDELNLSQQPRKNKLRTSASAAADSDNDTGSIGSSRNLAVVSSVVNTDVPDGFLKNTIQQSTEPLATSESADRISLISAKVERDSPMQSSLKSQPITVPSVSSTVSLSNSPASIRSKSSNASSVTSITKVNVTSSSAAVTEDILDDVDIDAAFRTYKKDAVMAPANDSKAKEKKSLLKMGPTSDSKSNEKSRQEALPANEIKAKEKSSVETHTNSPSTKKKEKVLLEPNPEAIDLKSSELGLFDFSLLYKAAANELHVHIKRAQNLRAMDSNGFSDPFVKLNLLPSSGKSFRLRSKTIKKTLNPEWNEKLVYYGLTEDDIRHKTLQLCVLDEDPIGYDFLGETRVPLKTLRDQQTKDYSVYLEHLMPVEEDEKISDRGRILLSLHYDPNSQQLTVGILRCSGLAAMDSNGYSDPYVKLYLKPDKAKLTKKKTKTKKKTLNPEFNEVFVYDIALEELANRTLDVTVWDYDIGKASDYIGGVQLGINSHGVQLQHWYNTLKIPNQTHQQWHNLVLETPPEVNN